MPPFRRHHSAENIPSSQSSSIDVPMPRFRRHHSAEKIPSSESSSIDVSGRESPGRQLYFGQFLVEIAYPPPAHSKLVSVPSSVDSVDDVRLNFIPDGGGIEEPERRVGETPGPGAKTFHGTDGLERFVESVLAQHLRQRLANNSLESSVGDLDVEHALASSQLYSDQLRQIAENVLSDLRLAETSSNLSSEDLRDLRVFCVPLCWSSKRRVEFLWSFSDMLKAMGPNPPDARKVFISELESQGPLLFDGEWIDKMDVKERDPKYRPHIYNYKSVRGLIHFVQNMWTHCDEFQESRGLHRSESFCNYLNELFPNLLRVLYGVAHRFCRGEPWFEQLHQSETFAGVPSEVLRLDPSAVHFP